MATERVLGVDIGSRSVKIAQVLLGDSPTVEAYASVALPPEVVVDGRVTDGKSNVVTEAIKQMLDSGRFTTKNAVIGLNSSSSVFFRKTQIPLMDEKTLHKSIANIVEADGGGLDMRETQVDFSVLGRDDRANRLNVMLYLANDTHASGVCSAAEAAGLNIVSCDMVALATLRAVEINPYSVGTSAIVDIGADIISVFLHRNGVPSALFLDATGAGNDASSAIADCLNLDHDAPEAEEYKTTQGQRFDLDVQDALEDYGDSLAVKIEAYFASFRRSNPDEPAIDSITLVGGGSMLQGLARTLSNHFDINLQYGRPDPAIGGDLEHAVLHLAAIGLATGDAS